MDDKTKEILNRLDIDSDSVQEEEEAKKELQKKSRTISTPTELMIEAGLGNWNILKVDQESIVFENDELYCTIEKSEEGYKTTFQKEGQRLENEAEGFSEALTNAFEPMKEVNYAKEKYTRLKEKAEKNGFEDQDLKREKNGQN